MPRAKKYGGKNPSLETKKTRVSALKRGYPVKGDKVTKDRTFLREKQPKTSGAAGPVGKLLGKVVGTGPVRPKPKAKKRSKKKASK